MPQQAYVWQRAWTPPVREAVAEARRDMAGLVVLGAEVSWSAAGSRTHLVSFDGTALAASGLPVGLALRVHGLRGAPGEGEARVVRQLLGDALERAARAGLRAGEVQVDLDCPASGLEAYRRWLVSLRPAARGVRLIFTALPSWLKRPSFLGLVSAADGYVLQVHGVAGASASGARLFSREEARRAVDLAGALGASFRLALPTYGYRLAFEQGRLAGVAAEGAEVWPAELEERRLMAPAAEVAALVRSLHQGRPAALGGLLWYRLPVRGDALNWTMSTLRAVQRGEAPRARVQGEAVPLVEGEGGWTVVLRNEGDDAAFVQGTVRVRWSAGRCLATDGLGGVEAARAGENRVDFRIPRGLPLPPGERRELGWLRVEGAAAVEVQVDDDATG
jgi:hypothetical protein